MTLIQWPDVTSIQLWPVTSCVLWLRLTYKQVAKCDQWPFVTCDQMLVVTGSDVTSFQMWPVIICDEWPTMTRDQLVLVTSCDQWPAGTCDQLLPVTSCYQWPVVTIVNLFLYLYSTLALCHQVAVTWSHVVTCDHIWSHLVTQKPKFDQGISPLEGFRSLCMYVTDAAARSNTTFRACRKAGLSLFGTSPLP